MAETSAALRLADLPGPGANGHPSVTPNNGLHGADGKALVDACQLIARHYDGRRGAWAYECFEHINATLFDGELPWPLILWAITPHGGCLGFTNLGRDYPVITLHPSLLGGTEKDNPWHTDPALLGVCYGYDVLVHECIHVKVNYVLGGWAGRGQTSHNNDLWVTEVNRLAPLLGIDGVRVGRSKPKRVPIPGETTKTGKPATKVVRETDGDLPFTAAARFPYAFRKLLGQTDFYRAGRLPYASAFQGVKL
jgi:hypothetical protein